LSRQGLPRSRWAARYLAWIIDALLDLKKAADAAREAGCGAIDPEIVGMQSRWYREAADAGIDLNAARRSKLQRKRHALATRMRDRADDYLRFARDLRVPFGNYPDVAVKTNLTPARPSAQLPAGTDICFFAASSAGSWLAPYCHQLSPVLLSTTSKPSLTTGPRTTSDVVAMPWYAGQQPLSLQELHGLTAGLPRVSKFLAERGYRRYGTTRYQIPIQDLLQ